MLTPRSAGVGDRAPDQLRSVEQSHRAFALAVPVNASVLSLVMRSPATPLSVENELIDGAAGATVSTVTFMTAEAALVTPETVSVAVNLWSPSGKGAVTKFQAPRCIRRRRAKQRCPVIDIHRAVRHCSSGQRQDRRIGNAIADNAGVR